MKWIWENDADRADEYADFFDSFVYDGSGGIKMDVSCDSNYALYLNGRLIASGQYPDYPWQKVYDCLDLTPHLVTGENELKITVWYYGIDLQTYYKHKPGLFYQVYSDGGLLACSSEKTQTCLSQNFLQHEQKRITLQIGFTFCYDTRKYAPKTHGAVVVSGFSDQLFPRPIKPLKIGRAVSCGKLIDGEKRIYDLGRESVGFVAIRFKAESGGKIIISYGEHLVDGAVRRTVGGRDFSVTLIANGGWTEYTNPFRRLGCRYLQAESEKPVEIEYLGIYSTDYPVSIAPFDAGSPKRQQIYDTAVHTLTLCMHEHYEDSPWREQALYALDSRNQMLFGYYAFKEYAYARANLALMIDSQRVGGLLPICFPSSVELTIPSFSLHYLLAVDEYLSHSGDIAFVKSIYGKLKELADEFIKRVDGGLLPIFYGSDIYWNFYEWTKFLANGIGTDKEKSFDLVLNCLFSFALAALGRVARQLNEHADAALFDRTAKTLNQKITERFFDKDAGLFRSFEDREHYSELGNALAVLCGAADKAKAAKICAALASENRMAGITLSMAGFKYDALLKTDRKKYGDYVLRDIDTTYSYMLEAGATSFWETIKGEADFLGAGSLCHGWSAMPVYYYHILTQG